MDLHVSAQRGLQLWPCEQQTRRVVADMMGYVVIQIMARVVNILLGHRHLAVSPQLSREFGFAAPCPEFAGGTLGNADRDLRGTDLHRGLQESLGLWCPTVEKVCPMPEKHRFR